MTNLNDTKIETCRSSADLIAYLYGELAPAERSSLETHLADCGTCTDEFADLSFARLDVYEWHRDEFAGMATPRFVIPYAEAEAKVSWLDSVRGLFASHGQWATVGGAFALIAVIFGGVFVLTMNRSDEVAVKILPKNDNGNKTAVAATPAVPSSGTPGDNRFGGSETGPAKSDEESQIVKVDRKSSKTPRTANAAVRKIQPRVPPQRSKAPRLNDFDDEEDNTLRLGDLIADIDTRK